MSTTRAYLAKAVAARWNKERKKSDEIILKMFSLVVAADFKAYSHLLKSCLLFRSLEENIQSRAKLAISSMTRTHMNL